jgi:hypothetical protein
MTNIILSESNFDNILVEKENNGKDLFITGVFAQADVVNRNHRIYPKSIMDREIDAYIRDYIYTDRAVGELNHPADRLAIDPAGISHKIVYLKTQGNDYIGKAQIINTPRGNIVKGLLEAGIKLGVSTRGYGSTRKKPDGVLEVSDNYKMICIDIVFSPSAPDAFVDAVIESELMESTLESSMLEHEFSEWLNLKKLLKEQYTQETKFKTASKLLKKAFLSI